jgi:hypothetical protein
MIRELVMGVLLGAGAAGLPACEAREEASVEREGDEDPGTSDGPRIESSEPGDADERPPAEPPTPPPEEVEGTDPGESAPDADEEDERRAPPVPPRATSRILGPAAGLPQSIRLVVRPVEAEEGEDGRGGLVPARAPVALDLEADAWHGRAADPVLRVGPLVFRRYEHPAPGVLRFVAADRSALPAGAEVVLERGEGPAERVVVTRSLQVP